MNLKDKIKETTEAITATKNAETKLILENQVAIMETLVNIKQSIYEIQVS